MSELTPGRATHAIALVLAPETLLRTRIGADLTRGESTNRIVALFEDCEPKRIPAIGDLVDAVDHAAALIATAEVLGLNETHRTLALAVDWMSLRDLPQ